MSLSPEQEREYALRWLEKRGEKEDREQIAAILGLDVRDVAGEDTGARRADAESGSAPAESSSTEGD